MSTKPLTAAQIKALHRLQNAGGPCSRPYGDNFRTWDRLMARLVERGLAEAYVHGGHVITHEGMVVLHELHEENR